MERQRDERRWSGVPARRLAVDCHPRRFDLIVTADVAAREDDAFASASARVRARSAPAAWSRYSRRWCGQLGPAAAAGTYTVAARSSGHPGRFVPVAAAGATTERHDCQLGFDQRRQGGLARAHRCRSSFCSQAAAAAAAAAAPSTAAIWRSATLAASVLLGSGDPERSTRFDWRRRRRELAACRSGWPGVAASAATPAAAAAATSVRTRTGRLAVPAGYALAAVPPTGSAAASPLGSSPFSLFFLPLSHLVLTFLPSCFSLPSQLSSFHTLPHPGSCRVSHGFVGLAVAAV
jgi:hypothetical protein